MKCEKCDGEMVELTATPPKAVGDGPLHEDAQAALDEVKRFQQEEGT